jgi:hypothetical protein
MADDEIGDRWAHAPHEVPHFLTPGMFVITDMPVAQPPPRASRLGKHARTVAPPTPYNDDPGWD